MPQVTNFSWLLEFFIFMILLMLFWLSCTPNSSSFASSKMKLVSGFYFDFIF